MKSEDRKGSTLASDAIDDRESRASDASEQVSGVTSGKGRRDEVGHTGIHPGSSSSSEIPGDAELVTPGELGRSRHHGEPSDRDDQGVAPFDEAIGNADSSRDREMLEWTPPPNIVPEGERSDR